MAGNSGRVTTTSGMPWGFGIPAVVLATVLGTNQVNEWMQTPAGQENGPAIVIQDDKGIRLSPVEHLTREQLGALNRRVDVEIAKRDAREEREDELRNSDRTVEEVAELPRPRAIPLEPIRNPDSPRTPSNSGKPQKKSTK